MSFNSSTHFDRLLRQQMQVVELPHWQALQQKAGISRRILNHFRQGNLHPLKLAHFQALGSALGWDLVTCLQQFGLVNPPAVSDPPALAHWQTQTFSRLQTLLTSYPTARQMAQLQPSLPAKNLTALFGSLDSLLQSWQIEPIGSVFEFVSYDPQVHQPDRPDIAPMDPVYIRFVGYRQQDRILCPAKVSRSLPPGMDPG